MSVSSVFLVHSHVFQRISTKFDIWYPYIQSMVMGVGGGEITKKALKTIK